MGVYRDESPISDAVFSCDDQSCWCSIKLDVMTQCNCTGCHAWHTAENSAPAPNFKWNGKPYKRR